MSSQYTSKILTYADADTFLGSKLEMPFLTIRQKNLSIMGSASMLCNSITQMKGWN